MATSLSLKCTLGRRVTQQRKTLEWELWRHWLLSWRESVIMSSSTTSSPMSVFRIFWLMTSTPVVQEGKIGKDFHLSWSRSNFQTCITIVPKSLSPCSMIQNLRLYTFIKYVLALLPGLHICHLQYKVHKEGLCLFITWCVPQHTSQPYSMSSWDVLVQHLTLKEAPRDHSDDSSVSVANCCKSH